MHFSETHKFLDCFHSGRKKFPVCTEEIIEAGMKILDSLIGNMVNVLCGQYDDESDKCDKLETPKKKSNQKRTKSFIIPMIDVFSSFQEIL